MTSYRICCLPALYTVNNYYLIGYRCTCRRLNVCLLSCSKISAIITEDPHQIILRGSGAFC